MQWRVSPSLWNGEQWIALVWLILTVGVVLYSAFLHEDKVEPTGPEKSSKSVFTVSRDESFDLASFLRHLRKGTFEVQEVRGGIPGAPKSLLLTSNNEITLVGKSPPPSSSAAPSSSSSEKEEEPAAVYQLNHLLHAQVMEENDEPRIYVDFNDQQSLVLACEAEDDLCFIAKGFHMLAIRLAGDASFVEDLLTAGDEDLPPVLSPPTPMKQVLDISTTVLSIPVMPIYGLIGAFSGNPAPKTSQIASQKGTTPER